MAPSLDSRILDDLAFLYGSPTAARVAPQIESLVADHRRRPAVQPASRGPVTQQDVFVIAYPDQVQQEGQPPLRVLGDFLTTRAGGTIRSLHLLPFYPSSSDDGFAVMDYRQVDPAFGTWQEVEALARDFRLVVDAVLNHASAQSEWFARCLRGEAPYAGFFREAEPGAWVSEVFRPREHPLLTAWDTALGRRHFWTTFSADQIDLDYGNPQLLLEILAILLEYARHGAQALRLDAIAYLWKEPGTRCIHHPKTHRLVKLSRRILETASSPLWLLTETNVPQAENLSYFGQADEAHWVYQFPLPGLVLSALTTGDASALTAWAQSLPAVPGLFFNFLASHDGIGVGPLDGILPEGDIERLVDRVQLSGGGVSYRSTPGGARRPYELNVTYFDALHEPGPAAVLDIPRFLAAHAILLCLAGIPALYFHSLVGSRNDSRAVERTGRLRAINREKLPRERLEKELDDPHGRRRRVFEGLLRLIRARQAHPAFHPQAGQAVLDLGPHVFALERRTTDDGRAVLCVQEMRGKGGQVSRPGGRRFGQDLLTGQKVGLDPLALAPYQTCWLEVSES